jgi:uncharacterized integral membrane protein
MAMRGVATGMRRADMGESAPPRRTPRVLRNLWISRRLVAASVVLGILLWFIVINNQPATVFFPFGLGSSTASIGVVVLVSAIAGSIVTGLVMTIVWALRRYRVMPGRSSELLPHEAPESGDRPQAEPATRTEQGNSDAPWTAR